MHMGNVIEAVAIFLTIGFVFSSSQWCKPAEEGQPFEINCSDPANKSAGVAWNVETSEISHHGRVRRLKLPRVTPQDRNLPLECVSRADGEVIQKCTMDVYHKPQNPSCSATKTGHRTVQFMCFTSQIYPDLRCNVKMIKVSKTRTELLKKQDDFEYTRVHKKIHGSVYYSAMCSVDIDNLKAGQYEFYGLLIPKVNNNIYVRNKTVPVQPITVVIDLHVFITDENSWPVNICQGMEPYILLKCHASGFNYPPMFQWFVDNITVEDTSGNVVDERENLSTYRLKLIPEHHGKTITCKATNPYVTSEDQIKLSYNWPPSQHPVFRVNDRHIRGTLDILEGETTFAHCAVDGGEPKVSTVNVQCTKGEQMFFFPASNSSTLSFTLKGSKEFNNSECTCRAVHKTQCYKLHSRLQIRVLSINMNTTGTTQNPVVDILEPVTENFLQKQIKTLMLIILAVFSVCFIFLIFVFCLCRLRKRNRNRQLSRRNEDQTSDFQTVSECPVYESIDDVSNVPICFTYRPCVRNYNHCSPGPQVSERNRFITDWPANELDLDDRSERTNVQPSTGVDGYLLPRSSLPDVIKTTNLTSPLLSRNCGIDNNIACTTNLYDGIYITPSSSYTISDSESENDFDIFKESEKINAMPNQHTVAVSLEVWPKPSSQESLAQTSSSNLSTNCVAPPCFRAQSPPIDINDWHFSQKDQKKVTANVDNKSDANCVRWKIACWENRINDNESNNAKNGLKQQRPKRSLSLLRSGPRQTKKDRLTKSSLKKAMKFDCHPSVIQFSSL